MGTGAGDHFGTILGQFLQCSKIFVFVSLVAVFVDLAGDGEGGGDHFRNTLYIFVFFLYDFYKM